MGLHLLAHAIEQREGAGRLRGLLLKQEPRVSDSQPGQVAPIVTLAEKRLGPVDEGQCLTDLPPRLGHDGRVPVRRSTGMRRARSLGVLDEIGRHDGGAGEIAPLVVGGEHGTPQPDVLIAGLQPEFGGEAHCLLAGLDGEVEVAGLVVAPGLRLGDVHPRLDVRLAAGSVSQLAKDPQRFFEVTSALGRQCPAQPDLALLLIVEARIVLELAEPLVRIVDVAPPERHLGVPEREPGPAPYLGVDAVEQIARVDPQPLGDVLEGGLRRLPPAAFDERQVAG